MNVSNDTFLQIAPESKSISVITFVFLCNFMEYSLELVQIIAITVLNKKHQAASNLIFRCNT